jgi:hypothetical protein
VGAIFGPVLAGQLADRSIATEKLLAFSHLVGAALVWQLGIAAEFTGLLALSAIYGLVYAPTLALTNSLAFAHLPDRDRDFATCASLGHDRLDRGGHHGRPDSAALAYAGRGGCGHLGESPERRRGVAFTISAVLVLRAWRSSASTLSAHAARKPQTARSPMEPHSPK